MLFEEGLCRLVLGYAVRKQAVGGEAAAPYLRAEKCRPKLVYLGDDGMVTRVGEGDAHELPFELMGELSKSILEESRFSLQQDKDCVLDQLLVIGMLMQPQIENTSRLPGVGQALPVPLRQAVYDDLANALDPARGGGGGDGPR